ncbi:hypothetical protein SADUNF_Sadunf13G0010200 [Salix dunnii]|uniref:Uncharacterized protein n=1 Tax=Salix dunnii TaxID=1413687 RepID=A0A835MKG5_9ROSI|nr:hypothetical protein SADUNF_Sadunf13G0010200 [Salix dunnii]
MASSAFQKGKMKGENPNTCRDIIASNDSPNSQRCNVSSITIPEPKIRIRIPKLLAKTMQRRSDDCITDHLDDHTRAKKERVVQPKSLLPEKFGLFFSSVFGKKKSPKASSKVHKNGDGYKSDVAGLDDGLYDGDQPFEVAAKSPLHLLEEEEEEGEEHGKPTIERRENKPSRAADMYLKVSIPFLSFFKKYTGLNFFRAKTITDHTVLRRQGTSHNLPSGVRMSDTPAGRQESSSNLLINPSRVPSTDQKLRMASFSGNTSSSKIGGKPGQTGEESREESGDELCKKRILMGEKCKPLNLSGSLHYDEDGILLPEVLMW